MKTVMLCSVAAASTGIAAHIAAAPRSFPFAQSAMVLREASGFSDFLLAPVPGDLNDDGVPDLLQMRRGSAVVSVLASVGRELWADPAPVFTLGEGYVFQDAIADDLNGDGIPDLVYWASRDDGVYRFGVLRGDGAGGFAPLPATDSALSGIGLPEVLDTDTIGVGDVTGDGVHDIVVAAESLLVLRGNVQGGYAAPEQVDFGGSAIELIDADEDGVLEIVHAQDSTVVVSRLSGGSWVRELEIEISVAPRSVAVSERPDNQPGVRVYATYFNTADIQAIDVDPEFTGVLGPRVDHQRFGGPVLLVADVVGGAQPDLIVGNGYVYVDLQLDHPLEPLRDPWDADGDVLAAADVDLDGDRDVIFADARRLRLAKIGTRSGGERAFESPARYGDTGFDPRAPGVAVGDFDGDGNTDAFTVSTSDNVSAAFYQEHDRSFSSRLVAPTVPAARAGVADLDGDGLDDVILPTRNGGTRMHVMFAEPGRGFASRAPFEVFAEPLDAAPIDADGDGMTDLVVQTADGMVVLRQVAPRQFEVSDTAAEPAVQVGVSVADLDGDGFDDVVIGTERGFSSFLSNGDGSFGEARPGPEIDGETEDLELSDLDGDGDPDLALLSSFGFDAVWIFRNIGGGAFEFVQRYELEFTFPARPQWIGVGDVSGDGVPDILTANDGSVVEVRNGDGSLGFSSTILISVPDAAPITWPNQFAISDMDADGFIDLVTVGGVGPDGSGNSLGGIEIQYNRSTPQLICPADLAAPSGVLDLADITAFVSAFLSEDPEADLGARFGVFDLADLVAFVETFVDGCD